MNSICTILAGPGALGGNFIWVLLAVVGGLVLILLLGILVWALKWYHKVEQGTALIINRTKVIRVTFQGGVVIPILGRNIKILRHRQVDKVVLFFIKTNVLAALLGKGGVVVFLALDFLSYLPL